MRCAFVWTAAVLALSSSSVSSAKDIYGLEPGKVELISVSTMTFGPDGILFIGDPLAATIYAVQTGDKKGNPADVQYDLENAGRVLAEQAGIPDGQITEVTVNPATGNLFVAVSGNKRASIVQVDATGACTKLDLSNIASSKAVLPNAAENKEVSAGGRTRNNRLSAITDLAFVDGELIVSGLSNANAPTNVWSLVFPFQSVDKGTSLEIYHAAHGRSETTPAIQTFIPFMIDGEAHVLAGFVCTPLVKFPVSKLTGKDASEELKGTTVAELGNRNRPLDMIAYEKDGRNYLLLANSARGVMKVGTDKLATASLTAPVSGGGTAGQNYETVSELEGTAQLDKLNATHAVVLIQKDGSPSHLKSVPLP